jgi:hypothetical protein
MHEYKIEFLIKTNMFIVINAILIIKFIKILGM